MSLHGGMAGAVNALRGPAYSSTHVDGLISSAAWGDAMAQDDHAAGENRPMGAARGIIIGVIVSIPLWALFAVIAYWLI